MLHSGGSQLLVVTMAEARSRAEAIQIGWDEGHDLWGFAPMPERGGLRFAAIGCGYNDDYNINRFELTVFNAKGKAEWTTDLPVAGEYDPEPALVAADLTGDGRQEVAVLTEYYGLPRGVSPEGESRVLTIYDHAGKLLVRAWAPGDGGVGLHVAPTASGPGLLMSTGDSLRVIRLISE